MPSSDQPFVTVYFPDKKDLARVKKAAKAMGCSVSVLVRQGVKLYAAEVLKTGRARAA
jgi:hypothetical protein